MHLVPADWEVTAFSSSSRPPLFLSFLTKLLTAFSLHFSSPSPRFQPSKRLTGDERGISEVIITSLHHRRLRAGRPDGSTGRRFFVASTARRRRVAGTRRDVQMRPPRNCNRCCLSRGYRNGRAASRTSTTGQTGPGLSCWPTSSFL